MTFHRSIRDHRLLERSDHWRQAWISNHVVMNLIPTKQLILYSQVKLFECFHWENFPEIDICSGNKQYVFHTLKPKQKLPLLQALFLKSFCSMIFFNWDLNFTEIYCQLTSYCTRHLHIGLGNSLLPIQHQAITWTNADLLSNGPLETNFSGMILIKIHSTLFKLQCLNITSIFGNGISPHYYCQQSGWRNKAN